MQYNLVEKKDSLYDQYDCKISNIIQVICFCIFTIKLKDWKNFLKVHLNQFDNAFLSKIFVEVQELYFFFTFYKWKIQAIILFPGFFFVFIILKVGAVRHLKLVSVQEYNETKQKHDVIILFTIWKPIFE